MGWKLSGGGSNKGAAPPRPRLCSNPLHMIDKLLDFGFVGTNPPGLWANLWQLVPHCFEASCAAEGGVQTSAIEFRFCSNMRMTKYGRPMKKPRCKCCQKSA